MEKDDRNAGMVGGLRRLRHLLFSRTEDADHLADAPPWRVGVSMAATWSWGAAVAVAIAVMHNKGFVPYLAWAGASMVAIPVFGLAHAYIPGVKRWKNLLPMVGLWAFIGFFAIVLNLSALKAALGGGADIETSVGLSETQALYVTLGVGLLIAWYIHKRGLRGSVTTDAGQLTFQFAGAIGIVIAGLATGARADIQMMVGDQTAWMQTAILGLLAGTTASGMQWQRIEAVEGRDRRVKASLWGGLIYSVFVVIVTFAGLLFDGSFWVSIPFLLAVLAVSTSTSDSGSALLQYIGQRLSLPASAGSLVTLGAVLVFPFIAEWGVTGIWTFYSATRWKIVAGLLVLTGIYKLLSLNKADDLHRLARKVWLVLPDPVYGRQDAAPDGGDPSTTDD
jgi:hypothetical protein